MILDLLRVSACSKRVFPATVACSGVNNVGRKSEVGTSVQHREKPGGSRFHPGSGCPLGGSTLNPTVQKRAP